MQGWHICTLHSGVETVRFIENGVAYLCDPNSLRQREYRHRLLSVTIGTRTVIQWLRELLLAAPVEKYKFVQAIEVNGKRGRKLSLVVH